MEQDRLIPVGKIVRTHGVRGGVKVYPYGESLAAQSPGTKLFAQPASGSERLELTLDRIQPQGKKFWVAHFKELAEMGEAEKIVGAELLMAQANLPPAEEGEYYHFELIGLSVVTRDGRKLGTLRTILETGSNDVYVVEGEGKEILIPAVEDVICEVDLESGTMVIDPPEGLIDDL